MNKQNTYIFTFAEQTNKQTNNSVVKYIVLQIEVLVLCCSIKEIDSVV